MIERLHIENYLLIETLDVDFDEGLNIITGETGAGKSILLGAISMLLGGKNDMRSAGRSDKNSKIEATFNIASYNLQGLFAAHDLDYDDTTTISRIVSPSGKSRAFINDLPVSMSLLKSVGDMLVDIHSQHQTLLLSRENFQMEIVDLIADNNATLESYEQLFEQIRSEKSSLAELQESVAQNLKDREYITFQLEQLERASLKEGEREELEKELLFLSSASQIEEAFSATTEQLNNMDGSVIAVLKTIEGALSRVADASDKAEELAQRLDSLIYELKDIDSEADRYLDKIDVNPSRLEDVSGRIDMLNTLMQRYSVSSEAALIELMQEYEQRLLSINLGGEQIESMQRRIEELTERAAVVAEDISKRRGAAIPKIESYMQEMLSELGMESGCLIVEMERSEQLLPTGCDKIKFLFSGNKGIEPKPIDKVASGGEMSRVMLILKSLTSKHKSLPTIIFDEIDTGVSGRIADKMGAIMRKMSTSIQTICITHLPQVAAKGNVHIQVAKHEKGEQTITSIVRLSDSERVEVLAKMLSGSDVTDAAREQALLLINNN